MLVTKVKRKSLADIGSPESSDIPCDGLSNGYKTQIVNGLSIKENKISPNSQTNTSRCDVLRLKLLAESELNYANQKSSTSESQNDTDTNLKGLELSKNRLTTEINSLSNPSNPSRYESWDREYSFPRLIHPELNEPFVLQPSLFHKNHVPPTIYFNTRLDDASKPPVGLQKKLRHLFRWKISTITPNTIRNCIAFMRFDIIKPSNTDNMYLGSWCKHMPTSDFSGLEEWRKVNHYPGSFHMGRKDKLWLRLKSTSEKFESFHPRTFVLPKDYKLLQEYWSASPNNLFIVKPPASARGNGIKVINDISQIPESATKVVNESKKSSVIVQQYISNPCLLENGHKFDLRVYVLVTSVDPLRVYVYDEGLVRFASSKYSTKEDGIIDQYMHLTNYFINKNNQEYQINNDVDSVKGSKWSLKKFWQYLNCHHENINTEKLWSDIIDIIVKTIISCEGPMTRLSHQYCKNDYTSYELFGFDIILDDNFKPWILEVNITPSLKSESNLDSSVKFMVIKDMFNLVGYHLPPPWPEVAGKLGDLNDERLFFDCRLYTENLTKRDKIKHLKYQKLSRTHNRQMQQEQSSNGSSLSSHQATTNEGGVNEQQPDGVSSSEEDSVSLVSKESILSDLSQSDVRVLMLTEDELSRCGNFRRVFPSSESSKYLRFFDRPRYYNLLLDAWEQKYRDNRPEGLKRLSNLAKFLD